MAGGELKQLINHINFASVPCKLHLECNSRDRRIEMLNTGKSRFVTIDWHAVSSEDSEWQPDEQIKKF